MSGALTPSFVFDLESNMRVITAQEYERLTQNLWWKTLAKEMQSGAKKERISWLLDSASIEVIDEGNIEFEEMVAKTTEYESEFAAKGLKVKRSKFEDLDGNGVQIAANWSRQIGAYSAYWPQKQVAAAIRAGESAVAYDGQFFFDTDHPLNPFDAALGTYANLFTGAASGSYPGALKIDDSVTLDVAAQNLGKAIAYIAGIKMPNGQDPRYLRPGRLIVPPRMMTRATQLLNAKFIAQAAASGGGGADVEAVVASWGLGQPLQIDELGAAMGGADDEWYLLAENITSDQLGALTYVNREAFAVTYYTGQGGGTGVDAILSRARELEWHVQGRNVVGYGHPYLLFKFKAS